MPVPLSLNEVLAIITRFFTAQVGFRRCDGRNRIDHGGYHNYLFCIYK